MPIPLPRSSPESQGVSTAVIHAFLKGATAAGLELHSFMLLRHAQVVAEGWWQPYAPDRIHLLYSLSKSFTATAIGFAESEGLLKLDDRVTSFFPDKLPEVVGEHLAAMTVHHLLEMGTGHRTDTTDTIFTRYAEDPVKGFLAIPPDAAPGSVFCYNSGATFMLSAILQALTEQKLVDYLEPRLFAPLGIKQKYWQETAGGITLGFSGLHLTTEAVARFGQLCLQGGRWDGAQLVPAGWVERASRKHINNAGTSENPDWQQGYGYQFWRCQHGHYRGDGAFGQYCIIMEAFDVVLVITSAVENMQDVLDLAWTHLLPTFGDGPLPADEAAQAALATELASAHLEPLSGAPSSPTATQVSGQTYRLEPYAPVAGRGELPAFDRARFDFGEDEWRLALTSGDGVHTVVGGYGANRVGEGSLGRGRVVIAANGAWSAPNTFTAQVRDLETPHGLTLTCQFSAAELEVARRWNVSFGPLELPTLKGSSRLS